MPRSGTATLELPSTQGAELVSNAIPGLTCSDLAILAAAEKLKRLMRQEAAGEQQVR